MAPALSVMPLLFWPGRKLWISEFFINESGCYFELFRRWSFDLRARG